jgi:hypothetical protein
MQVNQDLVLIHQLWWCISTRNQYFPYRKKGIIQGFYEKKMLQIGTFKKEREIAWKFVPIISYDRLTYRLGQKCPAQSRAFLIFKQKEAGINSC